MNVTEGEPLPELPPPQPSPDDEFPPEPAARPSRRAGLVIGLLALLVALAAAGGAAVSWWRLEREETQASEALAELRRELAAAEGRLASHEQRIAGIGEDADARRERIERLAASLEGAERRLASMSEQRAAPDRAPSLAEVEYLLTIANRELALAGNAGVALAALREADRRLGQRDDPALEAVRAAVNDGIAAVEAAERAADDGSIALRLASLARRVQGLPLRASLSPEPATRAAAADGEASGWQRFKRRLGELADNIFRVRRTDQPTAPLLAPEESFFLYRNLELDLKAARLAALSGDQQNYTASLESARDALQSYFVTSDAAVQAMGEALDELAEQDVAPDWPDISRPLALLRANAGADGEPGN